MDKFYFYSIENGQDGSAHPVFTETLEHAELLQYYLHGPWGESCTGSIKVRNGELLGVITLEESIDDAEKELKWCITYPSEYGSAKGKLTYEAVLVDLRKLKDGINFNEYSGLSLEY